MKYTRYQTDRLTMYKTKTTSPFPDKYVELVNFLLPFYRDKMQEEKSTVRYVVGKVFVPRKVDVNFTYTMGCCAIKVSPQKNIK